MSETAGTETSTAATAGTGSETETAPDTGTEPTTDLAAEVEKWKALSRKNEQQAKANSAAAKKLADIEEASKSEAQKLTDRAEAAERALAKATVEQVKTAVGAAKGLTLSQSMRLQGSTPEELEADADAFLAEIKGAVAAPPGFQGGPRSSPQGPDASAQKFAEFLRG